MTGLPYSFEPVPDYRKYTVTSQLKDYLGMLMEQAESRETIEQILSLIDGYVHQLTTLSIQNRVETIKEIYKSIDRFFDTAADENKKEIKCKTGCTACCFIDVDITGDEAAVIINYCNENGIRIDRAYLESQAITGRKTYSGLSRCVFLKDNLCSIYPVRPVACRKHWVKTDPALCDFSENVINQVGGYFDVNTEILASALLNIAGSGPFEKMMISELEKK